MKRVQTYLYGLLAGCLIVLFLRDEYDSHCNAPARIPEIPKIAPGLVMKTEKSWWGTKVDNWQEWQATRGTPCCQALYELGDVAERKRRNTFVHPPSCLLQAASCRYYDVYAPPPEPPAHSDDAAGHDWCWWTIVVFLGLLCVYTTCGLLYCATLPLKYGDKGYNPVEHMSYARRLLAVVILWGIGGGLPLLFVFVESWLLYRCHLWPSDAEGVCFMSWFFSTMYISFQYLPYRIPEKDVMDSWVFGLLGDYFGLRYRSMVEGAIPQLDSKGRKKKKRKILKERNKEQGKDKKTFMLAQMPHGIMPFGAVLGMGILDDVVPEVWPVSGVVATILFWTPILRHMVTCLGCREASSANIRQMFVDGFKASAVVTGGVSEMFVSPEKERLTHIRTNFGRLALEGGHDIIPIFGFGVSRTLEVWPCCNNETLKAWSRKCGFPIMFYRGAFWWFDCIPHRQQITMFAGRPIKVEKATGEITQEQARAVSDQAETAVLKMYNDDQIRPFWEDRTIEFVK